MNEFDDFGIALIEKLCNAKISFCTEDQFNALPANAIKQRTKHGTEYAIMVPQTVTIEDIWERYYKLKEELESHRSFLEKTESRLNNESFIGKAPKDIIEKEYKKWWDCTEKINFTLSEMINQMETITNILKKQRII